MAEIAFERLLDVSRWAGPHPADRIGIPFEDADDDEALGRWLVLAVLLGDRGGVEAALAGATRLEEAGASSPRALAGAEAAAVEALLSDAGLAAPDALAARLVRLSRTLRDHHKGSISHLAQDCDGLEDLGGRLAHLSPGVGRAAVLRFLRPLRGRLAAASDLPIDPRAARAAVHLGLLEDGAEEGAPTALFVRASSSASAAGHPALDDRALEWALERLGAASCARERTRRCPLADHCPGRDPSGA